MNPEMKKKWLDALRSGGYKQGRLCLRRGDEFCCLGVLCDISGLGKWLGPNDDGEDHYEVGSEYEWAYPPKAVRDVAGLDYENPLVGVRTLGDINDEGATFEEIADLIEEHL